MAVGSVITVFIVLGCAAATFGGSLGCAAATFGSASCAPVTFGGADAGPGSLGCAAAIAAAATSSTFHSICMCASRWRLIYARRGARYLSLIALAQSETGGESTRYSAIYLNPIATARSETGVGTAIIAAGDGARPQAVTPRAFSSFSSPNGVTRAVSSVAGRSPTVRRMFAHSSLQNVAVPVVALGAHGGTRLAVIRNVLNPTLSSAYFFAAACISWYGACARVC